MFDHMTQLVTDAITKVEFAAFLREHRVKI